MAVNRLEGDVAALQRLTEVAGNLFLTSPASIVEEDAENAVSILGAQGVITHVVPKALNIRSAPKIVIHTRITSLPLAHPMEARKSRINGKWSRVRAIVRDQNIDGFASERSLRDPLPPGLQRGLDRRDGQGVAVL